MSFRPRGQGRGHSKVVEVSRIDDIFNQAEKDKRLAFMPYLTAGYPDLSTTGDLIRAIARVGADIIEIGFPFSDPLADGPTIQMSSQHALQRGVTPIGVIDLIARLRSEVDCGLVAMTYVNPVHCLGYENFVERLAGAGFDGVIVPDLPPEEGVELIDGCAARGLDRILLVAPTSPDERIELAASRGSGFLYCVSVTGVTGARQRLSESVGPFLERVRKRCSLPLALGFGISTAGHIRDVAGLVDGVIVGSAIIDVMMDACGGKKDPVREVTAFVGPLIEAAGPG